MHRRTVVVALLVVLAGCNAFAGGDGTDRPGTATLTPVEVPTAESLRTATPTSTECLAPRVAADDRTPAPTPATPVPLAAANGTVDGDAIVAGHGAALDDHSFSLRMDGTRVRAMPGAAAFTYEGVTLGFQSVQVFAVAGTIYRLRQVEGGVSVAQRPYDPDSPGSTWYRDALTGENWLDERIGGYNYTHIGTRTWNGTEVRIFEEARDIEVLVGSGEALSVESTVFVDRRGVVRRVRQVRTLQRDTIDGIVNTTEVETFSVGEVGGVTVSRPDAFCVPGSEAVTVTTPGPNATAAGSDRSPDATVTTSTDRAPTATADGTASAPSTTGSATAGPPTG
ncbi:hypothetical protein [Halosimplex pelagicum]|uniref:Uncharacterized protein n=1 Tax=Halosimplex pelagicum TaxID=869886 RepID=A0A7D5SUY2_9EURY|nr:hypothetical protein [Halosimplex pelagicum]QLH81767.1 hypothetical protein HZS54_09070 [Halosimplex pelagicum]